VSTVDSGNLAACLLALRQGCLEIPDHPVLRWDSFEGLLDAIDCWMMYFVSWMPHLCDQRSRS
jgi:hypothetical protein